MSVSAGRPRLKGAVAGPGVALVVNQVAYGLGARTVLVGCAEPAGALELWLIRSPEGRRELLPIDQPAQTQGWSVGWFARAELPRDLPEGEHVLHLLDHGQLRTEQRIRVGEGLLQSVITSDVLSYFRASRSFGEIDRKDRTAHYFDDPQRAPIDARGGWLDASGDFSKFLSHLNYTEQMSPQQIPLCAWAFATAADHLRRTHPVVADALGGRLRDETLFGADFLVRFQHPDGWFHAGIFDALTKNLDQRVINAPLADSVRTQHWQAGFRHGGGMAIAALALASRQDQYGDFTGDRYYASAILAHDHLVDHNTDYLFGVAPGRETVLDDYCATMAAVEVLRAAVQRADQPVADRTRAQLRRRAAQLVQRMRCDQHGRCFLQGTDGGAPYHHAAESGLPVLALLGAADLLDGPDAELGDAARDAATSLVLGAIARARAQDNPFGHPRHVVTADEHGTTTEQFFIPHHNQTGYWWQGENANLGSWAFAALSCAPHLPAEQAEQARRWAEDLIGWVLGLNPFGACMLQGRGVGALNYSATFPNLPGGVLNGITSGFDDESDIDYAPSGPMAGGDSWRWAEQWIPHSAWLLLATSAAR